MRSRSLFLLLLAVVCGLVASIGISRYLATRPAIALTAPAPIMETAAIVIATKDVDRGDPIDPEAVALKSWPAELVPSGALDDLDVVVGQVARQKLFAGQPILSPMLVQREQPRVIPEGMRLVTIKVNTWSSVYGLVQPDDRVDVIMTLKGSGRSETIAKTILEDVQVWAVDRNLEPVDEDHPTSVSAQGVTLLVEPQQAVLVTLAANQGAPLWLALRPGGDRSIGATTPVNLAQVIQWPTERGPATPDAYPQQPPTWRVKTMRGAQVDEQTRVWEPGI